MRRVNPTPFSVSADAGSLRSVAAFFRPPFLSRAAFGGHVRELRAAARKLGINDDDFLRRPLKAILDDLYYVLRDYHQCEYVYKNALVNRLFLERHSTNGGAFLSELRCGESRADVAIFNGTSTVYEIKTELDSLSKLSSQLRDYGRVFDHIYVVASRTFVGALQKLVPPHVGIIAVATDLSFRATRESTANKSRVDAGCIFDCLRRDEYLAILRELVDFEPPAANSEIYSAAKKAFSSLQPSVAHDSFVDAMRMRKRSREQISLIKEMPKSLKYLAIQIADQKNRIVRARDVLHENVA